MEETNYLIEFFNEFTINNKLEKQIKELLHYIDKLLDEILESIENKELENNGKDN